MRKFFAKWQDGQPQGIKCRGCARLNGRKTRYGRQFAPLPGRCTALDGGNGAACTRADIPAGFVHVRKGERHVRAKAER
jgi:hypothetical protein